MNDVRSEQAPVALAVSASLRSRIPFASVWALSFLLVLYLGLKGGGYDTIVHSEVGIAVWWIVGLGALVGILPRVHLGTAAWTGVALLAGVAVWTAIGIGGSESAERSAAELARVSLFAGVLVLALCAQGRDAARATVTGLAGGIGVIASLAVMSRLHPAWFPDNATAEFLPGARRRLSYPVNYWNGVAALMAVGAPLLLGVAASARTLAGQALAAAALPITALAAMMTLSRGGAIAYLLGMLTYLVLAPARPRQIATAITGGIGAAILIGALLQRDAVLDALTNSQAHSQGDELLVMCVVVAAGVGLVQVAIGLWGRHGRRGDEPLLSRAATAGVVAGLAVVAVAVALAAGAPSAIGDAWDEFKNPEVSAASEFRVGRLGEASGSGRYQFWSAAIDSAGEDPLRGTGPGTFGLYWSREGDYWYGVRDAHSLFAETLGEQGIPGFLLITGFFALVLATGFYRLRGAAPERRTLLAAALAAFVAFTFMAAVDWVWELAVIPCAGLLLAGMLLAPGRQYERTRRRDAAGWARTAAIVLGAIAAALAILPPLAGTSAVRESRAAAAQQQLGPALDEAERAARAQPYAATPDLQRALVYERAGEFDAAATAARAATVDEPTNFRTWLILSRIEAQRGEPAAAVGALRRARELNPRSPFLGGGAP